MIGSAEQIAELMLKRRNLVDREFTHSSNAIAKSIIKYEKQRMTEIIYGIPEERTKTGKKKWKRTGHLRRVERAYLRDPFTVVVVNDARYARARHNYGKKETRTQRLAREAKGRQKRSFNPARVLHGRDEVRRIFRPIVRDVRRQTLLDILRATGTTVPEELL